MKSFLVKIPEGMLELWREAAGERKVTLSQMIREAVNRDIERTDSESDGKPAPKGGGHHA